jgi:hypothetical protein
MRLPHRRKPLAVHLLELPQPGLPEAVPEKLQCHPCGLEAAEDLVGRAAQDVWVVEGSSEQEKNVLNATGRTIRSTLRRDLSSPSGCRLQS